MKPEKILKDNLVEAGVRADDIRELIETGTVLIHDMDAKIFAGTLIDCGVTFKCESEFDGLTRITLL